MGKAILTLLNFLAEEIKLNDLRVYPYPHVEYQDGHAKYWVDQFAQRAWSVVVRVEEGIHDHGEGNDG